MRPRLGVFAKIRFLVPFTLLLATGCQQDGVGTSTESSAAQSTAEVDSYLASLPENICFSGDVFTRDLSDRIENDSIPVDELQAFLDSTASSRTQCPPAEGGAVALTLDAPPSSEEVQIAGAFGAIRRMVTNRGTRRVIINGGRTTVKVAPRAAGNALARLRSNLSQSFGDAFSMGARAGLTIKPHAHELTSSGSIIINPTRRIVSLRNPAHVRFDRPDSTAANYIWLISESGDFIVAKETVIPGKFLDPRGRRPATLGHPTLCRGCKARIAGEIIVGSDGSLTINNQSGRYYSDPSDGKNHLDNAAQVLRAISGRTVRTNFMDF